LENVICPAAAVVDGDRGRPRYRVPAAAADHQPYDDVDDGGPDTPENPIRTHVPPPPSTIIILYYVVADAAVVRRRAVVAAAAVVCRVVYIHNIIIIYRRRRYI